MVALTTKEDECPGSGDSVQGRLTEGLTEHLPVSRQVFVKWRYMCGVWFLVSSSRCVLACVGRSHGWGPVDHQPPLRQSSCSSPAQLMRCEQCAKAAWQGVSGVRAGLQRMPGVRVTLSLLWAKQVALCDPERVFYPKGLGEGQVRTRGVLRTSQPR